MAGGLLVAWLGFGLSRWTFALLLGVALLTVGLAAFAARRVWARHVLLAGGVLLLGQWVWRAVFVADADGVRLTTLPADSGRRLIDSLYPEPDGSLAAAGLVSCLGGLHDEEAPRFQQIMQQAYARTNPPAAGLPTPAIATYLGLQQPSAFDTIVIAPPGAHEVPRAALVFLHGFSGNFYVYCWEAAQAAASAKLLTLCPSLDATGAWWTPRGDATLSATLDYARALGVKRIYLAGLSNGAAGASVLALKHERELSGLVLISGMRAEQVPDLPVLVVQGASDHMMPASYARVYAAQSMRVLYKEFPGGHLVFLSKYELSRPVIAEFLSEQERAH
jgi:pimeloyl-ACP methyl ester carboxylesterase